MEFNGLANPKEYHAAHAGAETVFWTTKGLEITRIRMVSDPGYPVWDITYVDGILDGNPVKVQVPFSQFPKKNMKTALYAEAKNSGFFIRGLFSAISTLC